MTIFKRGSISLNCLMCGQRDFIVSSKTQNGFRILKCKRCGFIFKESSYFHPVSGRKPKPSREQNNSAR